MKLQIPADILSAAAGWAAKLAPQRPRVPVTAGIRLAVTSGELTMKACDFDVFGELAVAADASAEDGVAVVTAGLFDAVTKAAASDRSKKGDSPIVTLERDDGASALRMRCGRCSWSLPVMDDRDWPTFPSPGEPIGRLPADTLSAAVARVLPAVSTDDKDPPELLGMLFAVRDATLTLVGTNRYQMATAELPWQSTLAAADADMDLVMPVALLKMGLAGVDGDVVLHSDGDTVALVTAHRRITGRLYATQYKPWAGFMAYPEAHAATTLAVDTAELHHMVSMVAAPAGTGKDPDLLRLEFGPDRVGISLAAADAAEGKGAVDHLRYQGPPVTIGVTPRYLLAALECLGSPTAAFTLTSEPSKPFGVDPADDKGERLPNGYRHIVMARRIRDDA